MKNIDKDDRDLLESYVHDIPSIERVIAHMHLRGYDDVDFIRKWYQEMEINCWCSRIGADISNWAATLKHYIDNRAFFAALRDPERIPDARKRGSSDIKHASNWRGTNKEDIGNALG